MNIFIPPIPAPTKYFYDSLKLPMTEIAATTQSDQGMAMLAVYEAAAEIAQGLADVEIPGFGRCSLGAYALIVAPSGSGKSQVMRRARLAITEYENTKGRKLAAKLEAYRVEHQAWDAVRAALDESIRREIRKDRDATTLQAKLAVHMTARPATPRKVRLTRSDCTPLAFHETLQDWPNACLADDEAAKFFEHLVTGSGAGLFCQAWDGSPLSIDRSKQAPIYVEEPRVSMFLGTQSGSFETLLKKHDAKVRGSGLASRILPCLITNTNQGYRDVSAQPSDPSYLPQFYLTCKNFLEKSIGSNNEPLTRDERVLMQLSPEANNYLIAIRSHIELNLRIDGNLFTIQDFAEKMTRHIVRMAAVFELFQTSEVVVSIDSIERASNVVYWFANEFKRIFTSPPEISQTEKDAWEIWPALQEFSMRRGNRYLIRGDFQQNAPSQLRKLPRLQPALVLLQQWGNIALLGGDAIYPATIDVQPRNYPDYNAQQTAIAFYKNKKLKNFISPANVSANGLQGGTAAPN